MCSQPLEGFFGVEGSLIGRALTLDQESTLEIVRRSLLQVIQASHDISYNTRVCTQGRESGIPMCFWASHCCATAQFEGYISLSSCSFGGAYT